MYDILKFHLTSDHSEYSELMKSRVNTGLTTLMHLLQEVHVNSK